MTGLAALEGHWLRHRHFGDALLARVAERIRQSEAGHTGELMIAIEAVSPTHEGDSGLRALEVFGRLRAWDTPLNTGVLLYLALDRHAIHIIADRGIRAENTQWAAICDGLREQLRQGKFEDALFMAIDDIEAVLAGACPPLPEGAVNTNDLSNRPVLL